jgi:DNA helicase-2/ATP-dependent DNA helicase PcrA
MSTATAHAPSSAKVWSNYQEAIFSAMTDTTDNLMIDAKAGSGKTTTLVEGMTRWGKVNPGKKSIFVAFNKAIAEELALRVPVGAVAKTLHSVCYGASMRAFNSIKVDDYKAKDYAAQIVRGHVDRTVQGTAAAEMSKAYALLRGTMTDITNQALCEAVLADYALDMELAPKWLPLLASFGKAMAADTGRMTFDEMLTHVIDHDLTMMSYDLVLVDEAQDMNLLQVELLKRLVSPKGGRLVACGDPNQSCYRFRGADSAAMERMAEEFNTAETLPLSVTYRCGRSIVALAQEYVPAIQPAPNAAEGEVVHRSGKELEKTISDMVPGTMVVCRANAPLVGQALKLIREGRRAVVKGRDIGRAVIKLYNDIKKKESPADINDMIRSVSETCQLQADKLRSARKDSQADALIDRGDTLVAILEVSEDFDEAERRCSDLFSDTGFENAVTFSSIHKSKGLEADRVVWLFPEICDFLAGKAHNRDAAEQESNLSYIAITRAKSLLIIQERPKRDASF